MTDKVGHSYRKVRTGGYSLGTDDFSWTIPRFVTYRVFNKAGKIIDSFLKASNMKKIYGNKLIRQQEWDVHYK